MSKTCVKSESNASKTSAKSESKSESKAHPIDSAPVFFVARYFADEIAAQIAWSCRRKQSLSEKQWNHTHGRIV